MSNNPKIDSNLILMSHPPYEKITRKMDCTINNIACQKNEDCQTFCSSSLGVTCINSVCNYDTDHKCLNGGFPINYVGETNLITTICACMDNGHYIGEQCQYQNSFRPTSHKSFPIS